MEEYVHQVQFTYMRQKLKRKLSSQTHFSWIKLDTIVCVVRYLTLRNSAHIQYYGVAYSRYSVNEQMWIMRHARKVDFLATVQKSPEVDPKLFIHSHARTYLWIVKYMYMYVCCANFYSTITLLPNLLNSSLTSPNPS